MSKILLVDDDIELTDLLAEVLRLTGFEVEVANNGQEALDKLNESHQLVLFSSCFATSGNGLSNSALLTKPF